MTITMIIIMITDWSSLAISISDDPAVTIAFAVTTAKAAAIATAKAAAIATAVVVVVVVPGVGFAMRTLPDIQLPRGPLTPTPFPETLP